MPHAIGKLRCWRCLLLLLLLQVLGSAADALGVAYINVRPEVQSAALPVKVRCSCSRLICYRHSSVVTNLLLFENTVPNSSSLTTIQLCQCTAVALRRRPAVWLCVACSGCQQLWHRPCVAVIRTRAGSGCVDDLALPSDTSCARAQQHPLNANTLNTT
jgi:hypothetical protein